MGFFLCEHLTANRNQPSVYHPTRFELNAGTDFAWHLQWPLNSIQDTKMPGMGTALSWFRQLCFLFKFYLTTGGFSCVRCDLSLWYMDSSCDVLAQQLWPMGLAAPRHGGVFVP